MDQTPQFEQTFEQLEKLVQELETGNLSLEKALEKFENGVNLAKTCQTALTKAEQKVKLLSSDQSLQEFNLDNAP